jgi:tetratricopeptide (TPR) repeat protein
MKTPKPRQRARWFSAVVLSSVVVGWAGCAPTPGIDEKDLTAANRGVALMGRFDFDAAREVFARLAETYPDNPDIQVNLGIATMNRQLEGDEEAAKAIFDRVLEKDPSHIRALYNSALIDLHQGNAEAALPHFLEVAEAVPSDAEAAYHVGQCMMQLQRFDEALIWFERALAIDPTLRSASYRAFQAAQRLKLRDKTEAFMARFQALESNPQAHLVEFKYTRMGALSEVVALDAPVTRPVAAPAGPVFTEPVELGRAAIEPGREPNVTVCDIDNDGAVDLFVAGATGGESPFRNVVMLARDSRFEIAADHALARVDNVNTALWGDIDNDGLTDVYLCRRGPNQLWRHLEGGSWEDITAATGTGGGDFDTVDGALFDADHDGDLDIFAVNSDTLNELYNNNRDGTFRPLAGEAGLTGDRRPSRSLVVADLDADLDADLIVIHAEPPHEVFSNELLWEYRQAAGWGAFVAADIVAAVAGDTDADGRIELYTVDQGGTLSSWRPDAHGQWTPALLASGPPASAAAPRLALADVNGDGALDLVTSNDGGWRVISTLDGTELFTAEHGGTNWTLAALEPSRGPSMVSTEPTGGVVVWPPGPGRLPFAAVQLSGREDDANSIRSNASGIGARLVIRAGSRWTVVDTLRSDSGPGQSLQPLLLGLGDAPLIDFVTIDWSDGVLQTELDLAPGPVHAIAETQRQLSSCPVLFAWDGQGYAFVTDVLGVGGVGYSVGPGEYTTPRPWERVMLPSSVVPRDGRLLLALGEPMEETTYLDAARMTAYDVPPGWSMTLDERMGILGPEPTGRPVFFRRAATPVLAVDERGEDVTETLIAADLRAAPVGPLDQRFIGRLADEHVVTITFAEPLDALGEDLVLVADGWLEYPYSSTMFAAWQAGADYRAPTLSARRADGTWIPLLEQFGYPAGMPRRMSVPLPNLPPGTRELRVATNQEIYWDRLVVVAAESQPEVVQRQLPLVAARVESPGFAHRTTGPQRLPHYDWARRAPLWDTRFQVGYFTAFGDALELVAATDDAVAIFGPGEAVHLEFEAPSGGPPPGWTRVHVLETDGWCKDMDLFTRDGRTVDPLPARGRESSVPERLHAKYNTRYVSSGG